MPNDHFTVTRNPALLALRAPLPRRRHLQAHRRRPVPGGLAAVGHHRPDGLARPRHHPRPPRQRQLPAGDRTHPTSARAGHGLHHPQHRGGPHQRPHWCARPWPTPPTPTSSSSCSAPASPQPNLSLFPPGPPTAPPTTATPPTTSPRPSSSWPRPPPTTAAPSNIALATITDPRLLDEIQALASMWRQAGIKVTVGRSSRSPSSTTW